MTTDDTSPFTATIGDDAVLRRTARHPVEHLDIVGLDTDHLDSVTFECDEVASMCPVTEQPDLASVSISYRPDGGRIIESKSLKLYLWGFRDRGVFCEGMAQEIAQRVWSDARPASVEVVVRQAARGGIVTTARASREGAPPTP